jgi:hypothetical protein
LVEAQHSLVVRRAFAIDRREDDGDGALGPRGRLIGAGWA